MNLSKLVGNKKTPLAMSRVLMSVVSGLNGLDTDKRIISHLIVSKSSITKTLSTAQKVCVKTSCGCSIVKSKAIGSTWSRFTPTEPNWTEKPAVINNGDIQHFSGKEPKNGVFIRL